MRRIRIETKFLSRAARRSRYVVHFLWITCPPLNMSTADVSSKQDWAGRYYHIDQVLNAGGPRTDSQFAAGDEVGVLWFPGFLDNSDKTCNPHLIGEEIPQAYGKNPGYRRRGTWMRDPRQFSAHWLQRHSRY